MWPELALVLALIAVNASLAGTEIALISLREPKLTQLDNQGGTGSVVASLARNPTRFLATIQIGITLAGFLASAVAATTLAQPLVPLFSVFGDAAETVAVILVTLVLAFFTLVFGELVPKRLALQKSETWALAMGWPLHWFAVVMTPFVWVLSISTDAVVRLFGGNTDDEQQRIELAELADLIVASGGLHPTHEQVVIGAIEVADRTLEEVMTPRTEVTFVEADRTVDEVLRTMENEAFSRVPVVETNGGLDTTLGVVHVLMLVKQHPLVRVGTVAASIPNLPESLPVLDALRTLQEAHQQMALVVDEHGGVEGIVTVEDLVEELVGEIYDESDRDIASVEVMTDGALLVPGRFPAHDLVDLGLEAPEGEFTTVAGLILEGFGRLPEQGESVTIDGAIYTVTDVKDKAITRVSILPPQEPSSSE
ncbi:MAG: hemolysin family protein [Acidimicrobiia bacterium]